MSDPAKLNEDQAKILLQANLKNLAKKVQQGKTLSNAERKLLEASLDGKADKPRLVQNKSRLAEALGISRTTLYRYTQQQGAPKAKPNGSHDLREWEEFIERIQSGENGLTLQEVRAQQILLQNQKLEFQIGIMAGEYIRVEDVIDYVSRIIAISKNNILRVGPAVAPTVVGETVSEAERKITEALIEAMTNLNTNPEWER